MRKLAPLGSVFVTMALALPLAVRPAAAQDPVKVSPDQFKVLFENEQVRVVEFNAKPGAKSPMHSHPDHVLYIVTGGKARFTLPDGKSQEMDSKAGDVRWNPAGTHATESLSETKAILVELKKK